MIESLLTIDKNIILNYIYLMMNDSSNTEEYEFILGIQLKLENI